MRSHCTAVAATTQDALVDTLLLDKSMRICAPQVRVSFLSVWVLLSTQLVVTSHIPTDQWLGDTALAGELPTFAYAVQGSSCFESGNDVTHASPSWCHTYAQQVCVGGGGASQRRCVRLSRIPEAGGSCLATKDTRAGPTESPRERGWVLLSHVAGLRGLLLRHEEDVGALHGPLAQWAGVFVFCRAGWGLRRGFDLRATCRSAGAHAPLPDARSRSDPSPIPGLRALILSSRSCPLSHPKSGERCGVVSHQGPGHNEHKRVGLLSWPRDVRICSALCQAVWRRSW